MNVDRPCSSNSTARLKPAAPLFTSVRIEEMCVLRGTHVLRVVVRNSHDRHPFGGIGVGKSDDVLEPEARSATVCRLFRQSQCIRTLLKQNIVNIRVRV